MAKKSSGAKASPGGASVPASRAPSNAPAREDARPTTKLKPSALVDTRVSYCGDIWNNSRSR